MIQVLHIFRKDARHLWREIAASLALLVAFAWLDIRSWSQPYGAMAGGSLFFLSAQVLPGLVTAMLPVSWIFLIVRVVQGESLVGDRQFWVTRPYDWKQLLAAKALFVLTFVNFPLLLADAFLLAHAGFHPTHYLAGLLWLQLMWILVLFLWVAALASITKSVPQMLLALLIALLYLIGSSALSSAIQKSRFSDGFDLRWGFLVIGATGAVILIQYSRRKTALSRWLIVSVCIVLTLISVATQLLISDRALIAREYPLASGILPVELGLIRHDSNEGNFAPVYNGEVSIMFPLSVSGLPENSFLQLDGMIVTLTKPNGFRWDSGWQGNALWLFPEEKTSQIMFQMKQDIFDQLNSGPVNAHISFAFTLYRDKNQRQFVVPSGEFSLTDVGRCSTEIQYSRGIHCLAPLRRPAFLLVTSEAARNTCPHGNAETPTPPGVFVRAFVRGAPEPAEMGISPVHKVDIDLSDWDPTVGRVVTAGVCPGTPVTLSNPELAERRSLEVEFDNLSLDQFQQRLADR